MPTLVEYYNNDFKGFSADGEIHLKGRRHGRVDIENILAIKRSARHDSVNGSRMLTFYIPQFSKTVEAIKLIVETIEAQMDDASFTDFWSSFPTDLTFGTLSTVYSRRIYIYAETDVSSEDLHDIEDKCIAKNIYVTIRGPKYIQTRMELEKPLAFISHDSRDKELIAQKIAFGLNSRLCITWYDEFSLKVGQSLRESIERGIKEAKKCILIITPNFLSNPGWTKKEFNSIFTREMIFNEKVVLPIWYNVTKAGVYEYSPSLADTVALIWPNKEILTEEDYNKKVETLVSKLHAEIAM